LIFPGYFVLSPADLAGGVVSLNDLEFVVTVFQQQGIEVL
jgi:hypothetical protein